MTTISTYSELIASVPKMYANGRSDFTQYYPGFVQRCESDINQFLRTNPQNAVTTLTSASSVLTCPSDWLKIRSIRQTEANKCRIDVTDIERIERYLSEVTQTGDPEFATEVNGTIYLAPAPADGVTFRVMYHQKVPALSTSNETNWLLTKVPNIYIYGTLKHAALHDHDDGALVNYEREFMKALGKLISSNASDKFGERLIMQPNGGVA